MIIAPAYAPTDVDARPEASSPSANSSADRRPERGGDRVVRALDGVDAGLALQGEAASSSMRDVDRAGQRASPGPTSSGSRAAAAAAPRPARLPCRSRASAECR